jgi:hypothetical protein
VTPPEFISHAARTQMIKTSSGLSITNQTAAFVTAGPCVLKVIGGCIILSSAEPELIKNAQDRERQPAEHKDNSFKAVVPNDRCVVYDFRIATKQLIAPAVNEDAGDH